MLHHDRKRMMNCLKDFVRIRKPTELWGVAMDISGSMIKDRLGPTLIEQTRRMLRDTTKPDNTVVVECQFNHSRRTTFYDFKNIERQCLKGIVFNGSTNVYDSVVSVISKLQILANEFDQIKHIHILVITDGMHNVISQMNAHNVREYVNRLRATRDSAINVKLAYTGDTNEEMRTAIRMGFGDGLVSQYNRNDEQSIQRTMTQIGEYASIPDTTTMSSIQLMCPPLRRTQSMYASFDDTSIV